MAAFALPIISGLAGLFGSKPKTTTTNQSQSGQSSQYGTYNDFTQPILSDQQVDLSRAFTQGLLNKFNAGTDLTGYRNTGLQNINAGFNSQSNAIKNILAARGLSFSPASATPLAGLESQRIGQQAQFLNNLPLLQRQLQGEDLGQLVQGFSALPTAMARSGNSSGGSSYSSSGTSTSTGGGTNPLAGFFGGFGGAAAAPYEGGTDLDAILGKLFPQRVGGYGMQPPGIPSQYNYFNTI